MALGYFIARFHRRRTKTISQGTQPGFHSRELDQLICVLFSQNLVRYKLLEAAAARFRPFRATVFDSLCGSWRRRRYWRHHRQRHTWILHYTEERSIASIAHIVDVFQSIETTKLSEEEHLTRQIALCCVQQHWIRVVIN